MDLTPGQRLGRYTITRTLGRGGMGVVYVARDERLERDVALKMIAGLPDEAAVRRFWREARAAASVNHPNICQVLDVDEAPEGIFIAMELLDGEPLDVRLERGPLPPAEATSAVLGVLGALGALHARGLVHRDIKPANIFLGVHGTKLLDFGLARAMVSDAPVGDGSRRRDSSGVRDLTHGGLAIGTPRYMSPEQLQAEDIDHRTDLYSVGAVLFEMLAGRPPFRGGSMVDLMYAILHERAPALQGPPEVVAMDRLIRRAMAKRRDDRFPNADAMADELGMIVFGDTPSGPTVAVRALTRVVVPPLRLARPDDDVAYLSYGLAEAVSSALAALGDVVVRTPSIAAMWAEQGADPRRLATDADVDLVLAGSLMHSGERLRVSVQLIDAPNGTVLGARSVSGSTTNVFAFEELLAAAAIELLSPRRGGGRDAPVHRDVPASARAFELFLRGTEHARQLDRMVAARDQFVEAVREDPVFAPAWAALGRCHRVIGKYVGDREANERRAEDAFRRALALSPQLPLAHRYLTHLESEQGRAESAIARLLEHARVNRNDAQLFAGLVHACRYAGLTDASIAAHREALRLDPTVATSAEYTYLQIASDPSELASVSTELRTGSEPDVPLAMLIAFGQDDRARDHLSHLELHALPALYRLVIDAIASVILEPRAQALEMLERGVNTLADPEAHFLFTLGFVRLGAHARAIELLARIVSGGFTPARMLRVHPVFESLRAAPEFEPIAAEAERRVQMARAVFQRGGGPALLGVDP